MIGIGFFCASKEEEEEEETTQKEHKNTPTRRDFETNKTKKKTTKKKGSVRSFFCRPERGGEDVIFFRGVGVLKREHDDGEKKMRFSAPDADVCGIINARVE